MFPFMWNGVGYDKCSLGTHDGMYWCATEKDSNSEMKEWGYCKEGCPGKLEIIFW